MAIDRKGSAAAAEMSVNSVSIPHWYGGNDCSLRSDSAVSAIAYGSIPGRQGLDLKDLDFQGSDGFKLYSRQCTDAVDAYTQSYHIELELRKALDTGRIKYMIHRLIAKSRAYGVGIGLEHRNLAKGESILLRVFRSSEVGVAGFDPHP